MTTEACGLNGHGSAGRRAIFGAHFNREGMTVLTKGIRRPWLRRDREHLERSDGYRLIACGAVLLGLLGAGLLAVSVDAQYRYVLAYRHQAATSVIEATALDVGMLIFSLLALGLARKGLGAKTERALIVACAAGSALMNYAAADVTSSRSVLAYCMPPVFLAVVADRVVATTRRHVLGMPGGRSPWSVLGTGTGRIWRGVALLVLYSLRLLVDAPGTCSGTRRAILNATPLPPASPEQLPAPPADEQRRDGDGRQSGDAARDREDERRRPGGHRGRAGTKTARFLQLVTERHGPFGGIPLDQVSPISSELAAVVELDPGAARTALRARVLAAAGAPSDEDLAESDAR
jgi:hypothetical protein